MANDRVDFTRGAAERIARAVRIVEQGDRSQSGPTWKRVSSGGGLTWVTVDEGSGGGSKIRLGTIDATWTKGTEATVTQIKGDGTTISPTVTFTAKNWFADVTVLTGTKKVACAKVDSTWILIAAEC